MVFLLKKEAFSHFAYFLRSKIKILSIVENYTLFGNLLYQQFVKFY